MKLLITLLSLITIIHCQSRLFFGAGTKQSPAVIIEMKPDEATGQLQQSITWQFQAEQCEILLKTDQITYFRGRQTGLSSSCISRKVCGIRGPTSDPINCEEFFERLT